MARTQDRFNQSKPKRMRGESLSSFAGRMDEHLAHYHVSKAHSACAKDATSVRPAFVIERKAKASVSIHDIAQNNPLVRYMIREARRKNPNQVIV